MPFPHLLLTIFTVFALGFMAVASNAQADTIYLKSGQKITGNIVGDSPHLNLQIMTDKGIAYVQRMNVQDIEYADGRTYTRAGNTVAMSASDDGLVEEVRPSTGLWGAVWSGRANAGASLQTGNTEKETLSLDAQTKAKWDKHRLSAKAEYNRAEDEGVLTVDNRSLDFAHDYFFSKKWFWNSKLGFEQDEINTVDLRSNLGMGLGHQVHERDDLNLQYIVGLSYLREELEDLDAEDSLAYNWSLDYDQKLWSDSVQLFHNHELLVPSDDTENFLVESKTGVRVPVANVLTATAEIDFDWDNKPIAGNSEDDTTYSLKLGYEW